MLRQLTNLGARRIRICRFRFRRTTNKSVAHATSNYFHSSIYRRANEASHSPRAHSYHSAANCVRESLNELLTGSL